jgi:hypothetical protein
VILSVARRKRQTNRCVHKGSESKSNRMKFPTCLYASIVFNGSTDAFQAQSKGSSPFRRSMVFVVQSVRMSHCE